MLNPTSPKRADEMAKEILVDFLSESIPSIYLDDYSPAGRLQYTDMLEYLIKVNKIGTLRGVKLA